MAIERVFIFESGFVACEACAEGARGYNGIEGLKQVIQDAAADGGLWVCENCGKDLNPIEEPTEKITLNQLGDQEPDCPFCGMGNAMLNHYEDGLAYLKCRDCQLTIRQAHVEIKVF
jgi:hypothetical protein